jgi:hypothetical protein
MADHAGIGGEPASAGSPDERGALLVDEGVALVEVAAAHGVTMRLLGGTAIVLHCPRLLGGVPHRRINDIDAAIPPSQGRELTAALRSRGYEPLHRFNALHGDSRLIFNGPHGKLDVFVGEFAMCHRIKLAERLKSDSPTIPLSDLLATKLQVVELSSQDFEDIALLVREHQIGSSSLDEIDAEYLSALMARDWGFWRSASANLRDVADAAPDVAPRLLELLRAFEEVPKSRRWKMRARLGERVQWYETPGAVE